jgi:4-oxalocrotonate tautomerase
MVTVLIEEFDRENWASEGQLHCDGNGMGCGKAGTDPAL